MQSTKVLIEVGRLYGKDGTNIRLSNDIEFIDITCNEMLETYESYALTQEEIESLIGFLQDSLKGEYDE